MAKAVRAFLWRQFISLASYPLAFAHFFVSLGDEKSNIVNSIMFANTWDFSRMGTNF